VAACPKLVLAKEDVLSVSRALETHQESRSEGRVHMDDRASLRWHAVQMRLSIVSDRHRPRPNGCRCVRFLPW
jgi:hypothetical protein